MPIGICPAAEVFQLKLNQAPEGHPGIGIVADGNGDSKEEAI